MAMFIEFYLKCQFVKFQFNCLGVDGLLADDLGHKFFELFVGMVPLTKFVVDLSSDRHLRLLRACTLVD